MSVDLCYACRSSVANFICSGLALMELHGIKKNGNCNRKSRVQKLANCTLRDLAAKLDVHGRHYMLSYLSSLPISVLHNLDTKANKFYDRTN